MRVGAEIGAALQSTGECPTQEIGTHPTATARLSAILLSCDDRSEAESRRQAGGAERHRSGSRERRGRAAELVLAYSQSSGSTLVPLMPPKRISKCRCGPVLMPVVARVADHVAGLHDVANRVPHRAVLHVCVDAGDGLAVDLVLDHHVHAEGLPSPSLGEGDNAVGDRLDLGSQTWIEVLAAVVAGAAGAVAVAEAVTDVDTNGERPLHRAARVVDEGRFHADARRLGVLLHGLRLVALGLHVLRRARRPRSRRAARLRRTRSPARAPWPARRQGSAARARARMSRPRAAPRSSSRSRSRGHGIREDAAPSGGSARDASRTAGSTTARAIEGRADVAPRPAAADSAARRAEPDGRAARESLRARPAGDGRNGSTRRRPACGAGAAEPLENDEANRSRSSTTSLWLDGVDSMAAAAIAAAKSAEAADAGALGTAGVRLRDGSGGRPGSRSRQRRPGATLAAATAGALAAAAAGRRRQRRPPQLRRGRRGVRRACGRLRPATIADDFALDDFRLGGLGCLGFDLLRLLRRPLSACLNGLPRPRPASTSSSSTVRSANSSSNPPFAIPGSCFFGS